MKIDNKMHTPTHEKEQVTARVTRIVEKLIDNDPLFSKLNKAEMITIISDDLTHLFSLEQLEAIDDEDLRERLDKVLAWEAMSKLFDDLTPEQIAIFDAAVKRK